MVALLNIESNFKKYGEKFLESLGLEKIDLKELYIKQGKFEFEIFKILLGTDVETSYNVLNDYDTFAKYLIDKKIN